MFKDWYRRADVYVPCLVNWQATKMKKLLRNAYYAGRRSARKKTRQPEGGKGK